MELLFTFLSALVGGLVVVGGWLLTVGRKFQVLDDLKNDVESIEKFSKSSANAIVEIQTHLAGRGFVINQKIAYTGGSPLKLTEYGETLMKESGFDDTVSDAEKRRVLVDLVKAKNPATSYDIQQYSMNVMAELAEQNHPIAIPLKNHAYQQGLPLEIILNSAGILLRDEVLKEMRFSDAI